MTHKEAIKLLREQEKHTYEEYSHQTVMGLPSTLLDSWLQEQVAMIEVAISSLASQIPKAPDEDNLEDGSKCFYCPNCSEEVQPENMYCSGCGQRLDWSEAKEEEDDKP